MLGRGWGVWDGCRFDFSAGELEAFKIGTDLRRLAAEEAAWLAQHAPVSDSAVRALLNGPKSKGLPLDGVTPSEELARRSLRGQAAAARRKYATTLGNVDRINKALEYAKHLSQARTDDLDADPLALTCPNGTVDLLAAYRWQRPEGATEEEEEAARAAWLRPTDRATCPTRVAGVAYDPAATCPAWEDFVALVMPAPEDRAALQRLLGYCLSGDNPEAACVILRGPGGNGKSTLLNALPHVLGQRHGYAEGCNIEMFIQTPPKPSGGHNADEIDLPGARVYIATEPDPRDVLDMKKIKSLTGGDARKSRGAYEKASFSWVPRGVPILSVNKTPRLKDADDGTRRRLVFVPLEVNLKDLPEDRKRPQHEVEAEHRAEAAGILNWLLDGWRDYKAQGLALPEAWRDLRDRLLEGADSVAQFLREMTEPAEDGRLPRGDFNRVFAIWAEEEGAATWSSQAVNNAMIEAGHVTRKVRGVVCWPGLRWQRDAEELAARVLGRSLHPPEVADRSAAPPPADPPPF